MAAIRNLLVTWPSTGGKKPSAQSLFKGHTDAVRCLAFSPDCALLASGSSDGTVRLWEVATGREGTLLRGHAGWVLALAFTPDGLALASGGNDQTVRLWDLAAGREKAAYRRNCPASIVSLAYSPDGQMVATGDSDGAIVLRETIGGRAAGPCQRALQEYRVPCLRPRRPAAGFGQSRRKCQTLGRCVGAEKASLRGHGGWVFAVAFTPSGRAARIGR